MNTHYTYFVILAASLAGPLALSFDKKVQFYRKFRYVFPALIVPALLYITWDIFFTFKNVWSFNEKYISGVKLVNLPIEEVLFFLIVPFCCLFIYECVKCYFPDLKNKKVGDAVFKLLALIIIITGILFYNKLYTSWAFVLCALYMGTIVFVKRFFKNFNAAQFLVSYAIILFPFLIVNGFLTAMPVVLYNDMENMGTRIYTIPFEDMFYGMLLILLNVTIYEKLQPIKP